MNEPISVIVADDHPLFLEGIVSAVGMDGRFVVVGQATDAAGAVRLARKHVPDLAVLDVSMPQGGLTAARDIAVACPSTKIVMLTVSEDEDDLLAAFKAGASGYVLKGVSARELLAVLHAVCDGAVYVTPALAGRLLSEMTKQRPVDPLGELTGREREVLELVAQGLSNQEIGLRLGLAEKTVKHHMTNILSKLHLRSRVEVAVLAHRIGIASPQGRP